MSTLLVKNAEVLVTMNPAGGSASEIKQGAIAVEDNRILMIGPTEEVIREIDQTRPDLARAGFDKTLDASGCVIIPGLVNCHHHLYKPSRTIEPAQEWCCSIAPGPLSIWAEMTPKPFTLAPRLA
jgi:imidazolonepropionase-like amidohydrolase